jgi:DNA-directed RNA polymerase subunit L
LFEHDQFCRQNIITIEDPVEYRLSLIRQTQVNLKAGITFAKGLRSILRQDPDVIMVGEIRSDDKAEEKVLVEEQRPLGNLEGKIGSLLKKYQELKKERDELAVSLDIEKEKMIRLGKNWNSSLRTGRR